MQIDVRKYGFVPFWFWNGDQEASEVRRQVRLAAECGLNGLAIHAREGNKTPYLSDKWFQLVETACEEAKKHGLKIWIYDEEGYPSGTAGYKIQKISPLLRQQHLSFGYFSFDELRHAKDIVAVFDAGTLKPVNLLDNCPSKEKFLVFQRKFVDRYVDTMNPEVADHFIRLTHEEYKKRLGKYFGNTITYFYTDDVNFHMEGYKGLPWTGALDSEFRRRHGYGLLENLPALVEDLPDSGRIRKDYYGTLLDLFLANFAEPIYRWCDSNGVKFTGHLRGDEGPLDRAIIQFSSAMPFFEYEHVPGIDDFLLRLIDCRYLRKLKNSWGLYPIPAYKFVSSVANQLKDGVCGAEVLASCGWGYSPAEQNAQLSFEANMGINLFTPHDFSYATAEVAKRDHPPSFFFQQPYWSLWKHFHAKFARISQLLQRGTHHADVLVFYPESQTWADMDGESIDPAFKCKRSRSSSMKRLASFERSFAEICFSLVKEHIGFDIGSERIMERHALVKSGRLQVGKMSYGTIIIPRKVEYSPKIAEIFDEFKRSGGRIIFSSTRKEYGLIKDIQLLGDKDEIAVHTRLVDSKKEFFISNLSPKYRKLRLPQLCSNYDIYDPESDKMICSPKTLPPFSSIYVLPKGILKVRKMDADKSMFCEPSGANTRLLGWHIRRNNENIMLMDTCHISGKKIRLREVHQKKPSPARISLRFNLPKGDIVTGLLGERLSDRKILVNGNKVSVDRSYKFPGTRCLESAKIGKHLKPGENEIVVDGLGSGKRIEDFYLTGDFSTDACEKGKFGSSAKFAISGRLKLGNLAEQGMPFYWGSVSYLEDLHGKGFRWLDLGKVDGAVEIFLNGKLIGTRLYPPYRIYVGDEKFKDGAKLEIRLYNTAQNFFGPHRWENLNKAIVSIEHESPGKNCNFNVKPFGIYGPVKLLK